MRPRPAPKARRLRRWRVRHWPLDAQATRATLPRERRVQQSAGCVFALSSWRRVDARHGTDVSAARESRHSNTRGIPHDPRRDRNDSAHRPPATKCPWKKSRRLEHRRVTRPAGSPDLHRVHGAGFGREAAVGMFMDCDFDVATSELVHLFTANLHHGASLTGVRRERANCRVYRTLLRRVEVDGRACSGRQVVALSGARTRQCLAELRKESCRGNHGDQSRDPVEDLHRLSSLFRPRKLEARASCEAKTPQRFSSCNH